jgi:hypothetical protein
MPDDKPPVPAPSEPLPSPELGRAALERVLARAAELQAHMAEPAEGMSEQQLIELGQEVGIGPEHVKQALAEERTRVVVPEASGVVGSWLGAPLLTASRVVKGTPSEVLARLDQWMQREEGLRPRRRFPDRLTWEARRDFLGSIQAGFNFGGRAYALTSSDEVGATAVAIDAQRVFVRLDADFSGTRRRSGWWGGILAGGGVASGGGLVALGSVFPEGSALIGAAIGSVWSAIGLAGGAAVARGQRKRLTRGQLALEQILDRLEHGEIRSPAKSFLDVIANVRL